MTEAGSPLPLAELRRRIGDVSQVASAREVRLGDGNEDGVRAIDVRVAGGLSALVLADRGLDIGPAWVDGHPIGWQSTTGIVGPSHGDEAHWLRRFHGGLLTTCGLQNVGPPNVDEGVAHGIHGRVSGIPARNVTHRVVADGDRWAVEVSGELRETDVFGVDLVLRRTLRFPMGEPLVEIHDEVVNQGYGAAGLMLLYHCNIGWPVVADGAVLLPPRATVVPRDARAEAGLDVHRTFTAPVDGFEEQVFEHVLAEPRPARASIAIANPGYAPTGGIAVAVEFDPAQLPHLWHWRMLGPGMYLTGLEPATCGILGRAAERERGTVDWLAPGEGRTFDVTIRAFTGATVTQLVAAHAAAEQGRGQG